MFVLDQKYLICYSCAVLRGCWFARSGSPRCEWVGYPRHGGPAAPVRRHQRQAESPGQEETWAEHPQLRLLPFSIVAHSEYLKVIGLIMSVINNC